MNSSPSKKRFLSRAGEFIDSACLFLSPFAIFVFFIFVIFDLDALGTQISFVSALQEDGLVKEGIWNGISTDRQWGFVALEKTQQSTDGDNILLIPLQYYPNDTLQRLQEGQPVSVRYAPNRVESGVKGILEDEFMLVKYSPAFLLPYFWPLFICWLIVVIHPEFVLIGLPDINDADRLSNRGLS